jgi:hypothetical protein
LIAAIKLPLSRDAKLEIANDAQERVLIRHVFSIAVICFLGACASSSSTKERGEVQLDLPAYELLKDEAVFDAVGAHWGLAMKKCGVKKGMKEADIDQACILDLVGRSLPDTELVAEYCGGQDDFIAESDCLTMSSFAVDLARRAENPPIQTFLGDLPSKYGEASGKAAMALAEAIWLKCPDGPGAEKCRVDEATARLQTTPSDLSRCEALPEDRKIVSCLIIARFVHHMNAGTEKLATL